MALAAIGTLGDVVAFLDADVVRYPTIAREARHTDPPAFLALHQLVAIPKSNAVAPLALSQGRHPRTSQAS